MLNKDKLRAVISAHGENQGVLAGALGITRVTLCRKINERHGEFWLSEINAIAERYKLTTEQIGEIFSAQQYLEKIQKGE